LKTQPLLVPVPFWRVRANPERYKQTGPGAFSPTIIAVEGDEGYYLIPGVDYPNLVKVSK
jgi:hypothetical protein